jgi:uncharacterized protein
MKNIVEAVKEKLLEYNKTHFEKSGYDFWDEHIRLVFQNARDLAVRRGADIEICELAALFHDMALPAEIGDRNEHEKHGAKMARAMLAGLGYPKEKIELVEKCVLHHSGGKGYSRDTVEEQIIADADVLAHFDNIIILFNLTFSKMKLSISDGRKYMKSRLMGDWEKLGPESKKDLKERFDTIMKVLFAKR